MLLMAGRRRPIRSSPSLLTTNEARVNKFYVDILDRNRNPNETYWLDQLNAGMSREAVALGIIRSSEGFTLLLNRGQGLQPLTARYTRPAANTHPEVPGLYQQVLRRNGDSGGINTFVPLLQAGTLNDFAVMRIMTESLEYLFNVGAFV